MSESQDDVNVCKRFFSKSTDFFLLKLMIFVKLTLFIYSFIFISGQTVEIIQSLQF